MLEVAKLNREALQDTTIPAFSVQADGHYRIANSLLEDGNGACGEGIALRVYVNDQATKFIDLPNGHAATQFDHNLGELSAGDTVYVGIGSKADDGCDGFNLDYSIQQAASITGVTATSGNGAAVTLNGNGSINFDPTAAATLQATGPGDSTADTITFDWDDGTTTGTANATVNVLGTNEPSITATTNEIRPLDLSAYENLPDSVLVSDYRDDFQGPTPADGWSYMWNADGPIGNPADYADMQWEAGRYDYSGNAGSPDADPLAWGVLNPTGGHPGTGSTQAGSGGIDRFTIAAYEVPLDGFYEIGDSFFNRDAGTGNAELVVHVNDNAPLVQTANNVANQSFDTRLGFLSAGDTIYVGYGPATADGSDGFGWDFSIEYTPFATNVVADYRDDFQSPTPAPNWEYVWNENGSVGDPANYSALTGTGSNYDFDGVAGGPDADPLAYGNLNAGGGHPGRGFNDNSGGIDRFVLAGYTVPTDGVYEITDSFYNRGNASNAGIQLVVHVNDQDPVLIDYATTANRSFDVLLGELSAGDTVYVGVGPSLADGNDTFAWDFTIAELETPPLVTSVGPTAEGASVSINSDGTIHYDATTSDSLSALNSGESLVDTFPYTIQDELGRTTTATASMTVNGSPNVLSPAADMAATGEDTAIDIDAAANDSTTFLVADYADDFQGPEAAPGWSYLWNSLTSIGDPAGYAPMSWEGARYDFTGAAGSPDADPLAWGVLTGGGGHPGRGTSDGGGTQAGGTDRAVVAAYTVPQAGNYEIVDSSFGSTNGSTNNLAFAVHVGANAPVVNTTNDTNGKTFDADLGALNAGDTIYVAMGPNGTDGSDAFAWDYSIQFTTDPQVSAATTSNLGASVSVNGDGTINYDPTAAAAVQALYDGETATDTFTYTVTDPGGNTATSTVSLTVTGVNDAPTAVADPNVSLNEDDAPLTVDVLLNDMDIDSDANTPNDSIRVSAVTQATAGGTVAIGPGGANVSYDTNGLFNDLAVSETATDTFTYTIVDQLGATSTAMVTVTINGQNDAPQPDAGGTYDLNEGDTLSLDGSATVDPDTSDNPGLTYSWDINGDGTFGDATGVSPTVTWATLQSLGIDDDADPANPWSVSVEVSDGTDTVVSGSTTLTLANTAPAASITGDASAVPGFDVSYTLLAFDPSMADQNGQFTYNLDWQDGTTETFTGGDSITVTHNFQNIGMFDVELTATDDDGGTSAIATLPVNVVPVAKIGNDIYAGGTTASDRIIFYPTNSGVQVRYNSDTYPLDGSSLSLGSSGRLLAFGQGGSDSIQVAGRLAAAAVFDGGAGNDYLAGGIDNDTLTGGDSNDVILGSEGDNLIDGGNGNDRLEGRSGADTLFGGPGTDRLNGNAGDDLLDGGDGNDFLFGGLDNDLLLGRTGADTLNGYFGNDIVMGGVNIDQLFGGGGQDLLIGGTDSDRLRGDSGDDSLLGNTTSLDTDVETALDEMQTMGTPLPLGIADALEAWFTSQDRTLFGSLTDDGSQDDLEGGTGVDEFHSVNDRVRNFRDGETIL